jgi:hypothetical protein
VGTMIYLKRLSPSFAVHPRVCGAHHRQQDSNLTILLQPSSIIGNVEEVKKLVKILHQRRRYYTENDSLKLRIDGLCIHPLIDESSFDTEYYIFLPLS